MESLTKSEDWRNAPELSSFPGLIGRRSEEGAKALEIFRVPDYIFHFKNRQTKTIHEFINLIIILPGSILTSLVKMANMSVALLKIAKHNWSD